MTLISVSGNFLLHIYDGKHFEIWNNFLFEFSDLAHFSNFPPYEDLENEGTLSKIKKKYIAEIKMYTTFFHLKNE